MCFFFFIVVFCVLASILLILLFIYNVDVVYVVDVIVTGVGDVVDISSIVSLNVRLKLYYISLRK